MPPTKPPFTPETFRFFRDLKKNNKKVWMDANRDRYQDTVVQPFRRALEAMAPAMLAIDDRFDVRGVTGANFSRINRDIRFAKDKTPYRPQMYLKFSIPGPGEGESGQLYMGISADTVTAGFRIYSGGKRKDSTLALIAEPRVAQDPKSVAKLKKRLGNKYESYWYASEKGEWTQREGWPTDPESWKKIQAWIVRKKMKPAAATKPRFPQELKKVFRDLYPVLKFTSLPD
jgi:uncharacterized protein (TIGR02453 family)